MAASRDKRLATWPPADPRARVEIAELPYLERQAVLVVSPEEAVQNRETLLAAAGGAKRSSITLARQHANDDWSALSLASAKVPLAGIALVAVVGLAPSLLASYRAWRKTRMAALCHLDRGSQRAAVAAGRSNEARALYRQSGRPAGPDYPAASFHEDVLIERYGELRELLTRLGARRIEARVTRGRKLRRLSHRRRAASERCWAPEGRTEREGIRDILTRRLARNGAE